VRLGAGIIKEREMEPLTPNEIRQRITLTVSCTPPELVGSIAGKIRGYITQLEEALLKCKICGGITLACPNCMKADEVLVWIRHNLKKLEGK
jgi:hypothetical protein